MLFHIAQSKLSILLYVGKIKLNVVSLQMIYFARCGPPTALPLAISRMKIYRYAL